jgi:hypothetical protein
MFPPTVDRLATFSPYFLAEITLHCRAVESGFSPLTVAVRTLAESSLQTILFPKMEPGSTMPSHILNPAKWWLVKYPLLLTFLPSAKTHQDAPHWDTLLYLHILITLNL